MRNEFRISSEDVEPTAALVISRLFFQAQEIKLEHGGGRFNEYEDALHKLWVALKSLNHLAFAIRANKGPDGCHFSIAMGNEMNRVGKFIEEELKMDPWKEWK